MCNEQMLSPEGKVCSGLRGNVQKAAETTASPAKAGSNKNDDPVDRLGREHDALERLPAGCDDVLTEELALPCRQIRVLFAGRGLD